jgi:hypothetical protein
MNIAEILSLPIAHIQAFQGSNAELGAIQSRMEETFIVKRVKIRETAIAGKFIGYFFLA